MTVTVNGQTSHSESFSYADPHGRMVSKSLNGVSKAFTYDANHPHAAASLGENSYTYDLNGSQVGRVIGSTAYTLTYDGENRMIRVEPVGGIAANSAPARRKVMALQFAPTQGWDFDTPAPVFTFTPTLTRTPTPTATATLTPLPTGTATPTPEPSPTGTAAPTQEPTQTPDLPPTETPTPTPTPQPPPLESVQYFYDGDGTLVKSIVNGEVTYYVSRQFHLRVSGEETRIQKYYPFGGQPIAVRTQANGTDTLTWLLTDHLGSAQVTAAEGGAASGVQHYTAFGEVRSRGGEMPTVYQYTGQLSQMEEVGLYHYGARWFDPAGAHFTQADTLIPGVGNPLSWDRYAYVNYSPLVYVDPTGHKACSSDGDSFDTCTDPLGITSQEFAQNFNITFEGAWEESKQWSVLVAAAMVGARFGTVLGMDAARAFIRVYALNDGKQFTFGWGSCSECKGSGGYTYNSTTIRFESLWTWHPDNRIPNVIHELGHAFNNLFWTSLSTGGRARLPEALFSDSQKSISNFPDRDSTDPNYGYGGPFGFWQQSKETTPSEEFADNFIGWTFNYWERNEAGNMRANWMNTFMPVFVNMAASW